MKILLLLICLLIINSCSSKKGIKYNQRANGHFELYSLPENKINKNLPANFKRILVVSSNDLFGEIDTKELTISKQNVSQSIKVGGLNLYEKYLNVLKAEFGNELLIIDAGNSLKSFDRNSYTRFLQIVNGFAKLDYLAISIGNHDLTIAESADNHLPLLKKVINNSKVPFIMSNLIDLSSGKNINWENTNPYLIRTINGIKVGIISAIDPELIKDLPQGTLNGHYLEPVEKSLIKYSRILKKQGVQVILATVSSQQSCGDKLASELKLPNDKVNFDARDPSVCNLEDKLAKIIQRIPKDTVHAIISSNGSNKIANFIHDTPVVQNFSLGKHFSVLEIFYDTSNDAVSKEHTIIRQPIQICEEFFKETNDCYMNDNSIQIDKKIRAKFLNTEI